MVNGSFHSFTLFILYSFCRLIVIDLSFSYIISTWDIIYFWFCREPGHCVICIGWQKWESWSEFKFIKCSIPLSWCCVKWKHIISSEFQSILNLNIDTRRDLELDLDQISALTSVSTFLHSPVPYIYLILLSNCILRTLKS